MATLPPPNIKFFAFDTTETADPSGQRHISGGSFAFIKEVGEDLNGLEFNGLTVDYLNPPIPQYLSSNIKAIIFRTSGPIPPYIGNMRFYLPINDMATSGITAVQYAMSGIWQPNPVWPSGTHPSPPTAIPTTQNLLRQDGSTFLLAANDFNVTQYIYLNVIAASGHPLGTYGGGRDGINIKFRVLYDYFSNSGVV